MAYKEPIAVSPAVYELPDIAAVQALERGEATPEQQQRALRWIVEQAAGTYEVDYRENDRAHAFVSGRRFVGLQIVKLLKLSATAQQMRKK